MRMFEATLPHKYYNQVDLSQHKLATKKRSKSKSRGKSRRPKSRAKSKAKRKPFGGYAISFSGRNETMEQVFGKGKITPSEMTKKIWQFVKAKRLSTR
jgi:hypothetical protein